MRPIVPKSQTAANPIISTTVAPTTNKKEPVKYMGPLGHETIKSTIPHSNTNVLPGGIQRLQQYEGMSRASEPVLSPQPVQSAITGHDILTATFEHKGKKVAEEVVNRIETTQLVVNSFKDRLAYIDRQIKQMDPSQAAVLANLEDERKFIEKTMHLAKTQNNAGNTWVGSGAYRRLIADKGSVEEAKNHYVPACVNLRSQAVKFADGEVANSLNRGGAATDHRNGAVSLAEMKEVAPLLQAVNSLADYDKLTEEQQSIVSKALPFNLDIRSDIIATKAAFSSAVMERTIVIETQALQDLSVHFDALQANGINLDKYLDDRDSVTFSRVSLLDGTKKAVGKDYVIYEKTQILDMKAIYEMLDDKQLVFDGKGPFLDSSGVIHMPHNVKDKQGQPLTKTLEVCFFNISAQGNVRNEGPQKEINEKALLRSKQIVDRQVAKLTAQGNTVKAEALIKQWQVLAKQFDRGIKDGFDTAQHASMLLLEADTLLSVNCFSGKDRTGLLAALVTYNRLKERVHGSLSSKRKETKLMAKWGRELMSTKGIACSVVRANTGHKALKLSVLKVRLLTEGRVLDKVSGLSKRIGMFVQSGKTFFINKDDDMDANQLWAA